MALIGQTSEYVPNALGEGKFGMAHEFAYINAAISLGNKRKLGLGESLGKMVCDENFAAEVFDIAAKQDSPRQFLHPEISVIAACHDKAIPLTIHAGIGVDVIDQHPSFDGAAKGACSHRDFLIYTAEVARLVDGGVVLNIGSAVAGPEVLLKAMSMVANIGSPPRSIVTADFDIRRHDPEEMADETSQCYYFRDQKSIVTRIPDAFDGRGYYVKGDQRQTFVQLYKLLVKALQR